MNLYTIEKIRELEQERLAAQRAALPFDDQKPRRKPVFGPLAATAGRTLRRFGEGLESWGSPPRSENEQPIRRGVR